MDDTMQALNVKPKSAEELEEGDHHGRTFTKKIWSPDTRERLKHLEQESDDSLRQNVSVIISYNII